MSSLLQSCKTTLDTWVTKTFKKFKSDWLCHVFPANNHFGLSEFRVTSCSEGSRDCGFHHWSCSVFQAKSRGNVCHLCHSALRQGRLALTESLMRHTMIPRQADGIVLILQRVWHARGSSLFILFSPSQHRAEHGSGSRAKTSRLDSCMYPVDNNCKADRIWQRRLGPISHARLRCWKQRWLGFSGPVYKRRRRRPLPSHS